MKRAGIIAEEYDVEAATVPQTLHGLRLDKPAKDVQKALLARDILAGTAGDPAILRLLPAFILKEEHIDRLRAALVDL